MNTNITKYKIAYLIAKNYIDINEPSYTELLICIHKNSYRTIMKVPITAMFIGIVELFTFKNIDDANIILNLVKEVIQEAMEINNIELIFTDDDWDNLQIVKDPKNVKRHRLECNGVPLAKDYMFEFFEN